MSRCLGLLGLVCLVLMWPPLPAEAAIALVTGQTAGNEAAAGATTIAVTLPGAVTAGGLIVVGIGNDGAQTVSSVADTIGNPYVSAVTAVDAQRVSLWYARNITGGAAPTITATFSASSGNRRIAVGEYSGADTTSTALHGTNSKLNADTTTPDSGAVVPTVDGCLFVGIMTPNANAVATAPGGSFIERFEATADGWQYEDQVQVTAASLAATWTISPSDPATAAVAVFRPPAAGGGSAAPRRGLMGVGQ